MRWDLIIENWKIKIQCDKWIITKPNEECFDQLRMSEKEWDERIKIITLNGIRKIKDLLNK